MSHASSALPLAPKEYSAEYMARLLKQLNLILSRIDAVKPLEGGSDLSERVVSYPISALTLIDIPTSPDRLPSGSVWSDGGILKIVS